MKEIGISWRRRRRRSV